MALGYSPLTLRWFRVMGLTPSDESDTDSCVLSLSNVEVYGASSTTTICDKLIDIHESIDTVQDFLRSLVDNEDFDLNFDS